MDDALDLAAAPVDALGQRWVGHPLLNLEHLAALIAFVNVSGHIVILEPNRGDEDSTSETFGLGIFSARKGVRQQTS